jgi:predicted transcriptional regulator
MLIITAAWLGMNHGYPIETLLTINQTRIVQVLSEGDELTCNEIIELTHVSRSGFYSAIKNLVSSGLIKTISSGRMRTYQINRVGMLFSEITKMIAKSHDLSTSDLEEVSRRLKEVLLAMDRVAKITKEIELFNDKNESSIFERLRLRKLRKERDSILQKIGYYGGNVNEKK